MWNYLKKWWKQTTCQHLYATLIRWHWVHDRNYDPHHIEAEYVCDNCGKTVYLHLYGKEAKEWQFVFGTYKQF